MALELTSDAVPLHEAPLDGDVCLAVGGEDHGCSPALLAACDAYETFIDDCPEHARAAQATFERLWSAAEAVFDAPCTLPTGVNRNPLPLAGRG